MKASTVISTIVTVLVLVFPLGLLEFGESNFIRSVRLNPAVNLVQQAAVVASTENDIDIQDTITISFVGDIFPGDTSLEIDSKLSNLLQYSDLAVGNLEGVILDSELESQKCNPIESCYVFSGGYEFANFLSTSGFDAVNLANNHALDFGDVGLEQTKLMLGSVGLDYFGTPESVTTYTVNGISVAIIGASPFRGSRSLLNISQLQQSIQELSVVNDIVILYFHGGGEGEGANRVPIGSDWYNGENRGDLRAMGRAAIDAGADLVIGSGPHLLRGIESYKNVPIVYSLGNFITGSNRVGFMNNKNIGMLYQVRFTKDGGLVNAFGVLTKMQRVGKTVSWQDNEAMALVNQLSLQDFAMDGMIMTLSGQSVLVRDAFPDQLNVMTDVNTP